VLTKRFLTLNGLAIFAVVCNHASSWGSTAMFWWTDRYLPGTVPNFSQIGTIPYYFLLLEKQLTIFSVPAFLFVSGLFVAFASRGSQQNNGWKVPLSRITSLIIPYFIWSFIFIAIEFILGDRFSPLEYLQQLLTGQVSPGYYYVPLLCQFYLLSPLITRLAKNKIKLLLVGSIFIQIVVIGLRYGFYFWHDVSPFTLISSFPDWFFGGWLFFFVSGTIIGLNIQRFKEWLSRKKIFFVLPLLIFGIFTLTESELISRSTGMEWTGPLLITSTLYAIIFVLFFLSITNFPVFIIKIIDFLGQHSYGIFLIHYVVLLLAAKVIYHIAPVLLSNEFIYQPVLIILAIGIPVICMTLIKRSPIQGAYRYLFG
jgi:probable poly-beta-1,6-N-acetyl-D-glucosamine export protein